MTRLRLIVKTIVIPLALAMSGCTITGPADDGFENSNESIDIGKLDATGLIGVAIKKASDSKNSAEQSAN